MKTGQALIDDIDRTALPRGAVAFWWLGQLGYAVKLAGQVLYFDPYLAPRETRQVPPLLAPEEVTHAAWVLGSHDHNDHIDPVAIRGIAAASPGARFVCSRVARGQVLSLGVAPERVIGMDEGTVHEEAGLRISAIAAEHEFFDRDPQLGYPYLCFIVEGDGVTILHTGDTLRYDGLVAKLSRWRFDLVFLPAAWAT